MLKRVNRLVLLTMTVFLAAAAAGESYYPKLVDPLIEPWRIHHVEELDGLAITCADEAADGTMWFGGEGKLVHYDGLNVKVITLDEQLLSLLPQEESEPVVRALVVARDGSLLLIINNTFVQYLQGAWKVVLAGLDASWHPNDWLLQMPDGSVWIQSATALRRYSESLDEYLIIKEAGDGSRLTAFCRDPDGDVWLVESDAASEGTLYHIPFRDHMPVSESDWRSFPVPCRVVNPAAALKADHKGRIWYGDSFAENGLLGFDAEQGRWMDGRRGCRQGHYSMASGHDGTVWIGGYGELLSVRDDSRILYDSMRLDLPEVRLFLRACSGDRLWIIGEFMKIYMVDTGNERWRTYPGLHFQCESADGRRWFISEAGRVASCSPDGSQWQQHGEDDGVIAMPVVVTSSSDGLIWAAGSHQEAAAVSVFNGREWRRFTFPEFATGIGYRSGFEAADGFMYFGASGDQRPASGMKGGALKLKAGGDGESLQRKYLSAPEIPYRISGFAQTPDGTVWVGASVIHYYERDSDLPGHLTNLPASWTDQLAVDGNGILWVAKGGFGIYRRNNDLWQGYREADGLASDVVSCLWPLDDGSLLAGTDAGISRFDGVSWSPTVFPEIFSMRREGGTLRQSSDGAIWLNFASREWYFRNELIDSLSNTGPFNTVRYCKDKNPPETDIVSYLDTVAQPGNTHIRWSGRDVWADTPVDQLEFSWRINGGDWSPFSRDTGHTFLDLPSGRHVLEVRSRDHDFNVDPTPARIAFSVIAPIWMQFWFIAMVLLMVAGTIAFVWLMLHYHDKQLKDRQRHLEDIDQLKTGFFTNISHELRTPLTVIQGPLERLTRIETDADKKQMLTVALRNTHRVSTLVSQLLDFRKLEQDKMRIKPVEGDMAQCLREVVELQQPVARSNQLECILESPDRCHGWFDPDMLTKIAHNLINNAIKYTGAGGRVRVVLRKFARRDHGQMIELTVEDTGPGIEPEHQERIFERFYRIPEKSIVDGSGIGLHLTRELVTLWAGEIRAESPANADPAHPGTRFIVTLPIERAYIP